MQRLKKIGNLLPISSAEISVSPLGIGFEKLDRNVFDPETVYDPVAALGVKWVRIQSGWARTETVRGVYDFAWLDSVVDNLLSRGLRPWLCLCYGNGLYDEAAAKVFGAAGCPPIHTEEQRSAWLNYVRATVAHFAGRISLYEIWNEPDGTWCWKHGVNATELGVFTRETAKVIRKTDPDAKICGLAVCTVSELPYANEAFASGMGEFLDYVSFHQYEGDERTVVPRVRSLRALARRYNPAIDVIQGESGSQSRPDGNGALWWGGWTPRKQAKQLLRHAVQDLAARVVFSSYFTAVDMVEALNGTVDDENSWKDFAYFGVLGAEFDGNGDPTGRYAPKPSYFAYRNLCSLIHDDVRVVDELPVFFHPGKCDWTFGEDVPERDLTTCCFEKDNGSCALAFWSPTDLMTVDLESTVTLSAAKMPFPIRLIDPYDGSVYEIPESILATDAFGTSVLKHLPVRDYPMFLTFGDFADFSE